MQKKSTDKVECLAEDSAASYKRYQMKAILEPQRKNCPSESRFKMHIWKDSRTSYAASMAPISNLLNASIWG